jgi:hypothetical protein
MELIKLDKGRADSTVKYIVLILTIALPLSVGFHASFAAGPMNSENPSSPTTATNAAEVTGKEPAPACDEWWSPLGLLTDCPIRGQTSKESPKDFSVNKAQDGTVSRTITYSPGRHGETGKSVTTITPDGTETIADNFSDGYQSTIIKLRNPGNAPSTRIIDSIESKKPYAMLPTEVGREVIDLEKKPYGYSGKQKDGTDITFYRDPSTDSPSSGHWVTETKDTEGKVTTISRNNDRSFIIATKNPDGTTSTATEKPDGTNIETDSGGITTTTNPDGTWYKTFPKSANGSIKIYYSDGKTVIKKPDGTTVPQP